MPPPCYGGLVYADANGNGQPDAGEAPLPGMRVSDGVEIVITDAQGRYVLSNPEGRSTFVIKPAGYDVPRRTDGTPDHWHNVQLQPGPALRYGGIPERFPACHDFGLVPRPAREALRVWVFTDPQPKSRVDVDYYDRDIVQGRRRPPGP
nr:metallophosphoesterase N-terminal domain-containing protein [Lysobacter solisilvae]